MKYILMIILLLCIGTYLSFNRVDDQKNTVDHNHNMIIEPKLYSKVGENYIEISATNGQNNEYKVILNQISAILYQDDQNILANLTTPLGIFDIQSQILMINQGLSVKSNKFNLESASCTIKLNSHSIVFYKPKVEIL